MTCQITLTILSILMKICQQLSSRFSKETQNSFRHLFSVLLHTTVSMQERTWGKTASFLSVLFLGKDLPCHVACSVGFPPMSSLHIPVTTSQHQTCSDSGHLQPSNKCFPLELKLEATPKVWTACGLIRKCMVCPWT